MLITSYVKELKTVMSSASNELLGTQCRKLGGLEDFRQEWNVNMSVTYSSAEGC
jgi:hypothetical protein